MHRRIQIKSETLHQRDDPVLTEGQRRKEGFSAVYTRDRHTAVQCSTAWFIHKVLLTHSHTHLRAHGPRLLPSYNTQQQELALKVASTGPVQKTFADPWFTSLMRS